MAQRDIEPQPEAPDLGASVQLESAEHLAGPPDSRTGLDAGYVPPDRPYALDEDGVTARGMQEGDTLDQRLAREQPDVLDGADTDRAGRITMADEGAALETPDALQGVDVGIDGGAASAEEAAVHVVDVPGAPVEVEPSLADSPALADPELDLALGDDPLADRAREQAAEDVRADGDAITPTVGPVAEGSEVVRGGGGVADLDGAGPDPALPRYGADVDPAVRLDEDSRTDGAAAGAAGRRDAGPGTGL